MITIERTVTGPPETDPEILDLSEKMKRFARMHNASMTRWYIDQLADYLVEEERLGKEALESEAHNAELSPQQVEYLRNLKDEDLPVAKMPKKAPAKKKP